MGQHQHLYNKAAWRKLRGSVLSAAPLCRMCLEQGRTTAATVVDLITAHRGDLDLFHDPENLQPLCKPCHDRHAQRRDKGGDVRAIGVDGWPVGGIAISKPRNDPFAGIRWMEPATIPLTIVCGAPASGKSTWVRDNAEHDALIICMDTIAARMFGQRAYRIRDDKQWVAARQERNNMLRWIMRPSARKKWSRAYYIATMPTAEERAAITEQLKPDRVVIIAPGQEECMRRAMADKQAGDARTAHSMDAIRRWYHLYRPRAGEEVIGPDQQSQVS